MRYREQIDPGNRQRLRKEIEAQCRRADMTKVERKLRRQELRLQTGIRSRKPKNIFA